MFSIVAAPFYILTDGTQRFQCLHIFTNTFYFLFFFNSSHPNGYAGILFFIRVEDRGAMKQGTRHSHMEISLGPSNED